MLLPLREARVGATAMIEERGWGYQKRGTGGKTAKWEIFLFSLCLFRGGRRGRLLKETEMMTKRGGNRIRGGGGRGLGTINSKKEGVLRSAFGKDLKGK